MSIRQRARHNLKRRADIEIIYYASIYDRECGEIELKRDGYQIETLQAMTSI